MIRKVVIAVLAVSLITGSCNKKRTNPSTINPMEQKVKEYAEVSLTTNTSTLTDKEKEMLPYLFEAAHIIDEIFWLQVYGDKKQFLGSINDSLTRKFALINYGPWDALNNHEPFIEGAGVRPAGARFYPSDMTKEEFESLSHESKTSLYTLIQRDENRKLIVIPYHQAYETQIKKVAELITKAASLAEDKGLKDYLLARAKALLTDDYKESDMLWMDMKTNTIDFVVGPIETYQDQLFGYKAAFEAYILVKDKQWSKKLEHYAALLPKFQTTLPVDEKYKKEVPGSDSDLGVYDALFYAGDCNSGSKTIAINLPNDEEVQQIKGSRKLQLKNSMKAKFDAIMLPISNLLIDSSQRKHITFDAFFQNVMFHEVAHGLGMGNTINGNGTVRQALKETYTTMEESKADILGLYIVTQLAEMGELSQDDLINNYITFMAGIFRSVRFGAASAHGKANMIRFYYFEEKGAFTRNADGTYKVNIDKLKQAMTDLTRTVLTIQGNGDYHAADKLIKEKGAIREPLASDLARISKAGIPKDVVFKQGLEFLK